MQRAFKTRVIRRLVKSFVATFQAIDGGSRRRDRGRVIRRPSCWLIGRLFGGLH